MVGRDEDWAMKSNVSEPHRVMVSGLGFRVQTHRVIVSGSTSQVLLDLIDELKDGLDLAVRPLYDAERSADLLEEAAAQTQLL